MSFIPFPQDESSDLHIPDSPGDRAALREALLAQTPRPWPTDPEAPSLRTHGVPSAEMGARVAAGALHNAQRAAELAAKAAGVAEDRATLERETAALVVRERRLRRDAALLAGVQASDRALLRRFQQRVVIGAGLLWGAWFVAAGWLMCAARWMALHR